MATSDTRTRILLVEDDEIQAVFVQAVLAQEYDVVIAQSLCDALESLSYKTFDAVVLDLGLPDSVGVATLQSVAAAAQTIPVVVLTAAVDDASLEVFRFGAQDVIRKSDFSLQTLRRSLRYAMERKRLEERIVHGRKLEAVGELSAGVAHEFNNLLQAIRGYAKMALDDVDRDSIAAGDLKKVVAAADDAARLTRNLLSFGRRVALRRERLDLNELLRDQMEMIEPLIEETVEIKTNIMQEPVFVTVDATEIRQIVMNLCINARDAMPDGGQLHIESGQVVLEEGDLPPGNYAQLEIRDSGCGMSPEVLSRVFEPFFTTKEVGRGTGMGTSMVYGAVRQHGGDVFVTTELGVGSSFRILLPQSARAPEVEREPEFEIGVGGDQETVLIIEDDPSVRELCNRVLSKNGYRTLIAKDGVEAIQVFESNRNQIDLILMDVVLPRMTGRDVYEMVTMIEPNVPFIFCTGYDVDGDHASFTNDAKDCVLIPKPFPRETLLREVHRAITTKNHKSMATV